MHAVTESETHVITNAGSKFEKLYWRITVICKKHKSALLAIMFQ